VADALSYAHELGVIHRDIKPSNILFDAKDQPILTDFGIAKILETDEATLTGTGLGVGTPEYMAPEQWRGQAFPATDQYALGVVLYELITGQKPYMADTPAAVAIMQATEPLCRPNTLIPGIPDSVEKLLFKALANNPHDRYEDMAALRETLEIQLFLIDSSSIIPVQSVTPPSISETIEQQLVPGSEFETVDYLDSTPVNNIDQSVFADSIKTYSQENRVGNPKDLINSELIIKTQRKSEPLRLKKHEKQASSLSGEYQGNLSTQFGDDEFMTFVHVPAGEFWMGSDDDYAKICERPMHQVYLDEFWIGLTPVTNIQYAAYCQDVGIKHRFNIDKGDHPVSNITWLDANDFCSWLTEVSDDLIRLPTEAEWEKAARGIDGRKYPWGNQNPTCSLANYYRCRGDISAVGRCPDGASPYGALDMAGNVWEWVADLYGLNYYSRSQNKNPIGSTVGTDRVLRGGSWDVDEKGLRVSNRIGYNPGIASHIIGFRCLSSNPT
jgi:serine/threonine-protein kinase